MANLTPDAFTAAPVPLANTDIFPVVPSAGAGNISNKVTLQDVSDSIGNLSDNVSRTIFVDYVNGSDVNVVNGPYIGLVERRDRPFQTKAAAIAAALLMATPPSATNRVLINVAMGTSAEAISFPSTCAGIDFDLNGGSINVVSGLVPAVIDNISGVVSIDTIVYNANTLQTSAAGAFAGALVLGATSLLIINAKLVSGRGNGARLANTGTLIVNSDVAGPTGAPGLSCASGTLRFKGNSLTTAGGAGGALDMVSGTCTIESGSRIVMTGVGGPAIRKTGGVLILNSPTLITGAVNSVVSIGAQNILLYGLGQQNKIEDANTTYQVQTMTTDILVV